MTSPVVYFREDGTVFYPPFTVQYNGPWLEVLGRLAPTKRGRKFWVARFETEHMTRTPVREHAQNLKPLVELRYQENQS